MFSCAISIGSKSSPSRIVAFIVEGSMMYFPLMDSIPLRRMVLIQELSLEWQYVEGAMLLSTLMAVLGNSVLKCCSASLSSFWILSLSLMVLSASCVSLRFPVSWNPMLIIIVQTWDVCCIVSPIRVATFFNPAALRYGMTWILQSGMQSFGRLSDSSVMILSDMLVLITPAYVLRKVHDGVWVLLVVVDNESVLGAIGVPGLLIRFTDTLGITSLSVFGPCVIGGCSFAMRVSISSISCLLLGGREQIEDLLCFPFWGYGV